MIRSNSKKAKENIRNYIVNGFDPTNYSPDFDYIEKAAEENKAGIKPEKDIFSMVKEAVKVTFYDEYLKHNIAYEKGRISKQQLFIDWCAGLPSIIDTCYYYNRSAVDDLGMILEETETEKARFTEAEAEEMLSRLIYREIFA